MLLTWVMLTFVLPELTENKIDKPGCNFSAHNGETTGYCTAAQVDDSVKEIEVQVQTHTVQSPHEKQLWRAAPVNKGRYNIRRGVAVDVFVIRKNIKGIESCTSFLFLIL